MNSRARISLIAKLVSLIAHRKHFKDEIAKNPQLLENILE
jgi:hypothetical protein